MLFSITIIVGNTRITQYLSHLINVKAKRMAVKILKFFFTQHIGWGKVS